MKKTVIVSIIAMISSCGFADIAILLRNDVGVVYQHGTTGTDPLTEGVDQALVQLVWSPTDSAQANIAGIDFLGATEYLLDDLTTTSGYVGTWSDQTTPGALVYTDADVGGNDINSGYFFVRIFEDTVPDVGDYYLQQYVAVPTLVAYDFLNPNTIYQTDDGEFGALGGIVSSQGLTVAIPEPAVATLVGLFGGAILFGRRIFKKA